MNATPFIAIPLLATFLLSVSARPHQDKPTPVKKPVVMQVFDLESVLAKHRASKRSYTRFFRVPSTDCGVYTLKKGARDGQSPHADDELYYVVKGKAKMQCDGKTVDLKPGSLLFIAAKAEHQFIDIEEDLELLVVFSSGLTQEDAAKKAKAGKKPK